MSEDWIPKFSLNNTFESIKGYIRTIRSAPPRQDVMTNMKADWCVHQIALWGFHSLFSCITDEKEWSSEICSFGNNVLKFQRLHFCAVVVRVAKILELCFELDPLSCLIHFWNQSHKINTSIWVNPLVIASNLLICNIYVFRIPKETLPSLNSRFLLSLKDSSLKHLLDFVEIKSFGRLLLCKCGGSEGSRL